MASFCSASDALQQLLHFGDGLNMFRIIGEVVIFFRVFLLIVKFLALPADIPFGVSETLRADGRLFGRLWAHQRCACSDHSSEPDRPYPRKTSAKQTGLATVGLSRLITSRGRSNLVRPDQCLFRAGV